MCGWQVGGVGVPKRQAGGAHLATPHPPVVSAAFVLASDPEWVTHSMQRRIPPPDQEGVFGF